MSVEHLLFDKLAGEVDEILFLSRLLVKRTKALAISVMVLAVAILLFGIGRLMT